MKPRDGVKVRRLDRRRDPTLGEAPLPRREPVGDPVRVDGVGRRVGFEVVVERVVAVRGVEADLEVVVA